MINTNKQQRTTTDPSHNVAITMSSDHNSSFPASTVAQSPPLPSTPTRFVVVVHSSSSSTPAPVSVSASAITNEMQALLAVDEIPDELSADEVAIVFSFLRHVDIMRARVCTTWRDAAKKTLVPLTDFPSGVVVDSVGTYNAMRAMSTALPNLQQLSLQYLFGENKYIDGDDPKVLPPRANWTSHDINIISRFRNLRALSIGEAAPLNGRYPVLFNFPLLQRLSVSRCIHLKLELHMLASFPLLKELNLNCNVSGNLSSLRMLKDSLEIIVIRGRSVRGDYMGLADFHNLKRLDITGTNVTGDVRSISEHDFPALKSLALPYSVVGGEQYEFERISDVPSFMQDFHLLLQRTPAIFNKYLFPVAFNWCLSDQSPDWYDREEDSPLPPFDLQFILAGPRLGWSWCSLDSDSDDFERSCEINWLDPEPSAESCVYDTYNWHVQFLKLRQNFNFYRGYHQPPSEHQYRRMCVGRELR